MPATIDAFAARFGEGPLHLLINNTGIMAAPLSRDGRGLDEQLAVDHVGHFRLFARLLPALRRARGARVVALSSRGHVRSAFDFEDPSFEHRPYDKMVAYGQSKTANVLFAVEADRRYQGDGIRAFALHPGAILETDLARNYDPEELKLVVERARRIGSLQDHRAGGRNNDLVRDQLAARRSRRRVLRELRHRAGQERGRQQGCGRMQSESGECAEAVGVERTVAGSERPKNAVEQAGSRSREIPSRRRCTTLSTPRCLGSPRKTNGASPRCRKRPPTRSRRSSASPAANWTMAKAGAVGRAVELTGVRFTVVPPAESLSPAQRAMLELCATHAELGCRAG